MVDRAIIGVWLAVLATAAAAGCGDGAAPVDYDGRPVWLWDAGVPDARRPVDAVPPDACPYTVCGYACTDTSTDVQHCGDCDTACSGAAGCVDSDCTCPSGFLPAAVADGDPPPSFNTDDLPVVSTRALFVGLDELPHQLRLSWDTSTVELEVDIELAEVTTPTVRLSYNRSGVGPRGTFAVAEGSLRLDRACADGVAGTLTDATLVEVAWGPSNEPIPGGCTVEVDSLRFDLGSDCAAE